MAGDAPKHSSLRVFRKIAAIDTVPNGFVDEMPLAGKIKQCGRVE